MSAAKAAGKSQSRRRKTKAGSTLKILSSKTIFDGRAFGVSLDTVKEPSGRIVQREIVRHPGSVVILAIDDSQRKPRVLLERQYRYAARDYLWELPAGRIDEGEAALAAAKRELLEETGYTAKSWKKALLFYPTPGLSEETMTVYIARELRPGVAQPEEDELIEHEFVPLARVLKMILKGKIQTANAMVAVLWFEQQSMTRK
jgi:ADP-ribose pyrophosphatase